MKYAQIINKNERIPTKRLGKTVWRAGKSERIGPGDQMKANYRISLLCLALAAALVSGGFALARPRTAAQTLPREGESLQAESLAEETGYILREVGGAVAIFSGGEYLGKTDITPPLLRSLDRSALQKGIRVDSLEELLKLIEDFDS